MIGRIKVDNEEGFKEERKMMEDEKKLNEMGE